jgi:hypothetical protein
MANLESSFDARFSLQYAPSTFSLRFGSRELSISRDFRQRYYAVHPLLDCATGQQRGHLEMLVLRTWLVKLSKARW